MKQYSFQLADTTSVSLPASLQLPIVPFVPHPLLRSGDAQTIGAFLWRGRLRSRDTTTDEARLFQVDRESRVLARCRWQANRHACLTLVMWHGMEGSTSSAYMLSTADKAFRSGFNVIRVNYRNCGGTEHLTPTLYHGGLTADLRVIIQELIDRDRLSRILLAGFSLGGNKVLKLAGEYGENPPAEVKALCVVSPSTDLRAGCELMMKRRNWIYHRDFLRRLKQRIRTKAKFFPELYDATRLRHIYSIREFDEAFVAPSFGFANANDYYAQASSLPLIRRIRVPTLIIHAKDDPFVPFAPLSDPSIVTNPFVRLVAPAHGGHLGFISWSSRAEGRFWAENRLVDFGKAISQLA